MTEIPNPWIPESRFILDEQAFVAAIEPPPAFLSAPSYNYLEATQIRPIVETLAEFM